MFLFLSRIATNHASHQLVNCTVGPAKIDKTAFLRFFVGFPIHARVRKLGTKNSHCFTHLRTLYLFLCLSGVIFACSLNAETTMSAISGARMPHDSFIPKPLIMLWFSCSLLISRFL